MSGRRPRSTALTTLAIACCAVAAFAAGCGGNDKSSAKHTPATVLTYAAEPPSGGSQVDAAAVSRTAAIMRARLKRLGATGATVTTSGTRLQVTIPDGPNARTARQEVGTTARLAFYDWETNVVGYDGRTAPTDGNVTGAESAGQPASGASQSEYQAVKQAAALKPRGDAAGTGPSAWFGIDSAARKVLCGPESAMAVARDACTGAAKHPSSFVAIPTGYVVVQAESDPRDPKTVAVAADAYFILRDRPALLGTDITNPEQNTDATTGEPTVTFDFTPVGRAKWEAATRAISERGRKAMLPGVDSASVANHFAIVLDDKLISVPFIDPRENPHGIDGDNGSQISGGFTKQSARDLTNLLALGPLPLQLGLVAQRRTTG
jgi:SecD/SecF fusion protein